MSAVLSVKLKHVSQGQSGLNRFYYFTDGAGLTDNLGRLFLELIFPRIRSIIGENTVFTEIEVKNLTNSNISDYVGNMSNTPGAIAGEEMPAFNAVGMKLVPFGNVFKAGGKRFPGIPEAINVNGDMTVGYQALLALLAPILSSIIESVLEDYIPGLARTEDEGVSWLFSQITETLATRLTTQNTRKVNSGGGIVGLLPSNEKFEYNIAMDEWDTSPLAPGLLVLFNTWILVPANEEISGFVSETPPAPVDLT